VSASDWRLTEIDGVLLLRCGAMDGIAGITHAFSTRVAEGGTDFDLGPADRELPIVSARRRSFMRAAGWRAAHPAILRQVHGVGLVGAGEAGTGRPEADGVLRFASDGEHTPIPAVRTADCVAVVVIDRRGSAVAALHGGWRGVAGGIGRIAVSRLAAAGVPAADLAVAMGPAILGCCYEVGEEVVSGLTASCGPPGTYARRSTSGRMTVDLHAALEAQLIAAGVPASAIHAAPYCTRCRNDLFFSFRGEGSACGRMMAAVGPAGGP